MLKLFPNLYSSVVDMKTLNVGIKKLFRKSVFHFASSTVTWFNHSILFMCKAFSGKLTNIGKSEMKRENNP